MRERENCLLCFALIVLLVYCDCWCSVALPQGAWVGLQCVIVVFYDHTNLLFSTVGLPAKRHENGVSLGAIVA